MSEFIDYYDAELYRLLDEKMNGKFGDFSPIIIDILLRKKYVYRYTNEKCLMEAEKMIDNCKEIVFKIIEDPVLGQSYHTGRLIEIGYIKKMDKLFSTINHEITHQLSYQITNQDGSETYNLTEENIKRFHNDGDKYITCGVETYDNELNNISIYGTGLMESLNEAASAILLSKRENVYFSNIEYGYSLISKIIPRLLSAGAGVSDLDVIVSGITSEKEFTKTLGTNFKDHNLSPALQDIKKINDATTILHKVLYNKDKNKATYFFMKPLYAIKKHYEHAVLIRQATKELGNATFDFACHQIEADERPITDELILELTTRYKKINQTLIHSASIYADYLFFTPTSSPKKIDMLDRIYCMYLVNQYKSEIMKNSPEGIDNISLLAKQGKVQDVESFLKNTLNIDLEKDRTSKSHFSRNLKKMEKEKENPYLAKLYHDDLLDGKSWDNSEIFERLKKINKSFEQKLYNNMDNIAVFKIIYGVLLNSRRKKYTI